VISTAALGITAVLTAALVAGATCWAALRVAAQIRDARIDAARGRAVSLLETFAPAVAAASGDPRAVVAWQPIADIARKAFPDEFALLDRAAAGRFPFSAAQIQTAHAQWTADWLAWERTHDAEYKRRAVEAEEALKGSAASAALRARLDAIEQEKLDSYQRRYQEYVTVAKALQALAT
jgi:hypothetical protein